MTATAGAQHVIILGATSAIGEATARLYADEGARFALAGRGEERLAQLAADLLVRGAACCHTYAMDLSEERDASGVLARMAETLGRVDLVFLFYGYLGDQRGAEHDLRQAQQILRVNFTSAAEWCLAAASLLERQDSGTMIAISSVAGDRGRRSNYIYGAAKAGLSVLVEGIAHRLARTPARAVVVKLGFVDTPMTRHIPKIGPLWSKPNGVARLIKAAAKGKWPVVYIPWFWRPIMWIIRALPAAVIYRTKL